MTRACPGHPPCREDPPVRAPDPGARRERHVHGHRGRPGGDRRRGVRPWRARSRAGAARRAVRGDDHPGVNSALFIVVVLELVRTIVARLEGGGFQLQPFLVIGIISATRDILTVGAELSLVGEQTPLVRTMTELGVNAGVVVALSIALVLVRRALPRRAGPGLNAGAGEEFGDAGPGQPPAAERPSFAPRPARPIPRERRYRTRTAARVPGNPGVPGSGRRRRWPGPPGPAPWPRRGSRETSVRIDGRTGAPGLPVHPAGEFTVGQLARLMPSGRGLEVMSTGCTSLPLTRDPLSHPRRTRGGRRDTTNEETMARCNRRPGRAASSTVLRGQALDASPVRVDPCDRAG